MQKATFFLKNLKKKKKKKKSKTKFLTLKVHKIKTTDHNLFKSSGNIKRCILIFCKTFQGWNVLPNKNMNKYELLFF